MAFTAVIFDLFGTLVDNVNDAMYHRCLAATAAILGVSPEAFIGAWIDEEFRHKRRCGLLKNYEAQLLYACKKLGVQATDDQLSDMLRTHLEAYGRPILTPRSDVLPTLTSLRDAGMRIGLISDCSWEVPMLWPETPLASLIDHPLFSCVEGARKPDPRLFQRACERLQAPPAQCLYVGDGDGLELTGATTAGMTAVLICAPHERAAIMQRPDPRNWQGLKIEAIGEVPGLIKLR